MLILIFKILTHHMLCKIIVCRTLILIVLQEGTSKDDLVTSFSNNCLLIISFLSLSLSFHSISFHILIYALCRNIYAAISLMAILFFWLQAISFSKVATVSTSSFIFEILVPILSEFSFYYK